MNIQKATQRYETWLSRHLSIIAEDLELKHREMRSLPFPFLRATYYRWAQTFPEICGDLARAPKALAVGDLHVENFGTWRDVEGRLIWGINDFDEAWTLPYTHDLVRLATSALLAKMDCEPKAGIGAILKGYAGAVTAGGEAFALAEHHTRLRPKATSALLAKMDCEPKAGIGAILKGYAGAVTAGGQPFALAEHHTALRHMATSRLHDVQAYWQKLFGLGELRKKPPAGAVKAIERMMPGRRLEWRISHRVAGLGSLGRERYVAVAQWHGGSVAREAKALAPSACVWAAEGKGTAPIHYQEILNRSVRCPDPFVRLQRRWIVRRLAPDCSRIELSALPAEHDILRLLQSMGWETANIHLGTLAPRVLLADLKKRPRGWLFQAARQMEKSVMEDFKDYSAR